MRARGAPGQRRRRAARGLRDLRRRCRDAFRAADGSRGAGRRPRGGRAHARRACRAARRGALGDAVFNVAHGALLTLGLARGDWDLLARGLQDRLHQQHRAHLFPRSFELAARARELGALGATISGAGPTVLVWCFYEQTGTVAEALGRETEGWARVLRAPFEPQGAYVEEL